MKITRAVAHRLCRHAARRLGAALQLLRSSELKVQLSDQAVGERPAQRPLHPLGGQIDPGFLVAKCIKHAFKTYPKARIGHATQLSRSRWMKPEISDDIYGITDKGEQVDAHWRDYHRPSARTIALLLPTTQRLA